MQSFVPSPPKAATSTMRAGLRALALTLTILSPAAPAVADSHSEAPQAKPAEREALRVERFEPDQLEIEAGRGGTILLRGSSLEDLTETRVIKGGVDARGIVGSLEAVDGPNMTARRLRITTTLETPPGHYRIQLRAGRGVVATFARFDLSITEPDLSPTITGALFDQPVVEHTPIRIRVRTSSFGALAMVRATVGEQTVEAAPLERDPSIAELEITALGVGKQAVRLVAVDAAGRTSEPMTTTIEIVAAVAELSITDMRFNPEHPFAGESIGAFVTIANTGTTDAVIEPASVLLSWTVGGTDNREFAVGSESVITVGHQRVYGPLIFEVERAGDHTVEISLDPNDLVVERDESNNTWNRTVAVGPRRFPDLAVVSATFVPRDTESGRQAHAAVRVVNQGTATATIYPPDVIVSADGFSEVRAGPKALILPPSNLAELEMHPLIEARPTVRNHWRFTVDPNDHVAESNEDNNSYVASADAELNGTGIPAPTNAALPDLVVDSTSVRPAAPGPGDSVFIVLGIRNAGTVQALLPAGYTFYEINGPMGRVVATVTQKAERIGPGKTLGMRSPDFSIAEAGTHEISIRLDPNHETPERNENNNLSTMTLVLE